MIFTPPANGRRRGRSEPDLATFTPQRSEITIATEVDVRLTLLPPSEPSVIVVTAPADHR